MPPRPKAEGVMLSGCASGRRRRFVTAIICEPLKGFKLNLVQIWTEEHELIDFGFKRSKVMHPLI